ncbi:hypothetical protein GCM10011348_14240 [Marinobacterium nitratireducens]|uniref:Lipoprotein n=1 Tax=Marinobacterium nitratireducens TaxID=518897 RepID=A0A918DQK7_9GAMM|nr:hypothetical protein [Marinobacterium nitratireducens]GGO79588.1 hypothetical protein GCM10011348_14240 [Marinobacterium nitratireducens]
MNNQRLLVLLLSVILPGCAALQAPLPEPVDSRRLVGMLSPSGDRWVLDPCYSRASVLLQDPGGLLGPRYTDRVPLPGLPLFVELEVSAENRVQRLLVAGGDVSACRAELNGIDWRAAGSDPDWEADFSDSALEVRDQSRLLRLKFHVEPLAAGGRYLQRWQGRLTAPGIPEQRVEIGLRDGECEDRSGIWYGLEALMKLNGDSYLGCVRYGNQAALTLPGRYRSDLVTDQGSRRTVELTLDGDKWASLVERYPDARGTVERSGRWRLMPSGKLMLHLLQRDGHDEQYLRLFSRRLDGSLVLEGEGPEFAPWGLRLAPVADAMDTAGDAIDSVGAALRRE